MGVFLVLGAEIIDIIGLPHARGGVSDSGRDEAVSIGSSPRPWGCFWRSLLRRGSRKVFPTPVGVFLIDRYPGTRTPSLPHARGGVSALVRLMVVMLRSSPRPWGCFCHQPAAFHRAPVFPTPVGVFLGDGASDSSFLCLPHARGGVSIKSRAESCVEESSPRPWGCFPGIDLAAESAISLPHARGGVSILDAIAAIESGSSPRPWGCFLTKGT